MVMTSNCSIPLLYLLSTNLIFFMAKWMGLFFNNKFHLLANFYQVHSLG
jgi:hypothetical protein